MADPNQEQTLKGAAAALAAFSLWGIFPLYFKAMSHVPAFEILAHRIVWTVFFVGLLIALIGRLGHVRAVFADRKLLGTLFLSSVLVSVNWLVFIWAVTNDRVMETSLGYFINPLVSVAFSFGFYGLIRKVAVVDAFTGLLVEVLLISPPILAYLVFIGIEGAGVFTISDLKTAGLLMLSGLLTASPLVLFAIAAKRLRLSTVGFFQYIAPTGHFLLAVFLFNEPFTSARQVTFALIWLALAIYTLDSVFSRRGKSS